VQVTTPIRQSNANRRLLDIENVLKMTMYFHNELCSNFTNQNQVQLNLYENLINKNHKLPLKLRHAIVQASQQCRLQYSKADFHKKVVWNTAANVIAPVFFGFIYWCLTEAKRQEIDRLYFVARDGQILWKIAQVICRNWNFNIDCRYLYASRQSLHFPSIQYIGEVELDWIFLPFDFLSIHIICERVNLSPEKIENLLLNNGFKREVWDKNLTATQRVRLKGIFKLKEVADLIVAKAEEYRQKAIGYFKQEGINDRTSFALVDIGWTGRSQYSFSKLLSIAGMYPEGGVKGFYFGLTEIKNIFLKDELVSFFIQPDEFSDKFLLCNHEILELFLSADHGSTIRYEKKSENYIPILRDENDEVSFRWHVPIQHKSTIKFTTFLTQLLDSNCCEIMQFQQITEDLLKQFIHTPTKEEAEVFGSLVFSQQQSDSKFYTLAPAYNLTDFFKIIFKPKYIHSFVWLPASVQRSSHLASLLILLIKQAKYGFVYSYLSLRNLGKYNPNEANRLLIKAIKCTPLVFLSKYFIRASIVIILRYLLGSSNYKKIKLKLKSLIKSEKP
jgi:hypothetical protein